MSAITTAVNFIRTNAAQEIERDETIELDELLIARIEALFEHFRVDSEQSWKEVGSIMDSRYGYAKTIWVLDSDDKVTTMLFVKGVHV